MITLPLDVLQFSKQTVIESYMSFIENFPKAEKVLDEVSCKSSFQKFLEVCSSTSVIHPSIHLYNEADLALLIISIRVFHTIIHRSCSLCSLVKYIQYWSILKQFRKQQTEVVKHDATSSHYVEVMFRDMLCAVVII